MALKNNLINNYLRINSLWTSSAAITKFKIRSDNRWEDCVVGEYINFEHIRVLKAGYMTEYFVSSSDFFL